MKKRYICFILIIILLSILIVGCYSNNKSERVEGVAIINMKNRNKHMIFYGSRHCNDKKDPIFKDIEKHFYEVNPEIVLVEGDANKNSYIDKESAIKMGEIAFTSYLGQKNKVLQKSVEPSFQEQFKYLLEKYDKEKVLAMYILRQLYQYQNQQEKNHIDFEITIERYVKSLSKNGFPINRDETKLEYIQELLKPYINITINNSNWTKVDANSLIYNEGTELNTIYEEIYKMRNENLKATIDKSLKEYDRVFIIMGKQHLLDEKDNIKAIFNNLTE